MKNAVIGATLLALSLTGCSAMQTSLGNMAAGIEAPIACAKISKTAAQNTLCMSAAGVAIQVGDAIADGEIKL